MSRIAIKGVVSATVRRNLGLSLQANEIALFLSYSEEDVLVGHEFKYMIIGEKSIEVSLTLRFVTQQFGKEFDLIPQGWKTIAVLETDNQLPKQLVEMKTVNSWDEESSVSSYLL